MPRIFDFILGKWVSQSDKITAVQIPTKPQQQVYQSSFVKPQQQANQTSFAKPQQQAVKPKRPKNPLTTRDIVPFTGIVKEESSLSYNPDRKRIAVCKIGSDHVNYGIANQDAYVSLDKIKIAMDGCGSGKYSEVGVRLFSELLTIKVEQGEEITPENFVQFVKETFDKLTSISYTDKFFMDTLCFTILACFELEDSFVVFTCGDGYILTFRNGVFEPIETEEVTIINGQEYPRYYIYNYGEYGLYEGAVNLKVHYFPKSEFNMVGVATDGFRYHKFLKPEEKEKFIKAFYDGKKGIIGQVINRNSRVFKDDITICI